MRGLEIHLKRSRGLEIQEIAVETQRGLHLKKSKSGLEIQTDLEV